MEARRRLFLERGQPAQSAGKENRRKAQAFDCEGATTDTHSHALPYFYENAKNVNIYFTPPFYE